MAPAWMGKKMSNFKGNTVDDLEWQAYCLKLLSKLHFLKQDNEFQTLK